MGNIFIADDFIKNGYTRVAADFKYTIVGKTAREAGIDNPSGLLAIYFGIISNDPNYDLTVSGLSTQWNINIKKVREILKQLENLGFLRRVRLNRGGISYLFIAFHDCSYAKLFDEFIKDFKLQCSRTDLMFHFKAFVESRLLETPAKTTPAENAAAKTTPANLASDINNKNNLNENKFTVKNINKSSKFFEQCNETQFESKNDIMNSTLLDKKDKEEETSEGKKGAKKPRAPKQPHEKNKAIQKELEAQPISDILNTTIGDNTPEQDVMANALRLLKVVEAKEKRLDMRDAKKASKRKRIMNQINSEIQDVELKGLLTQYVEIWFDNNRPMSPETYNAQILKLNELSSDIATQKEIVRRSIQKGYMDLYPLNSYKPKENKVQTGPTLFIAPEGDDRYKLATDENGNLLKF